MQPRKLEPNQPHVTPLRHKVSNSAASSPPPLQIPLATNMRGSSAIAPVNSESLRGSAKATIYARSFASPHLNGESEVSSLRRSVNLNNSPVSKPSPPSSVSKPSPSSSTPYTTITASSNSTTVITSNSTTITSNESFIDSLFNESASVVISDSESSDGASIFASSRRGSVSVKNQLRNATLPDSLRRSPLSFSNLHSSSSSRSKISKTLKADAVSSHSDASSQIIDDKLSRNESKHLKNPTRHTQSPSHSHNRTVVDTLKPQNDSVSPSVPVLSTSMDTAISRLNSLYTGKLNTNVATQFNESPHSDIPARLAPLHSNGPPPIQLTPPVQATPNVGSSQLWLQRTVLPKNTSDSQRQTKTTPPLLILQIPSPPPSNFHDSSKSLEKRDSRTITRQDPVTSKKCRSIPCRNWNLGKCTSLESCLDSHQCYLCDSFNHGILRHINPSGNIIGPVSPRARVCSRFTQCDFLIHHEIPPTQHHSNTKAQQMSHAATQTTHKLVNLDAATQSPSNSLQNAETQIAAKLIDSSTQVDVQQNAPPPQVDMEVLKISSSSRHPDSPVRSIAPAPIKQTSPLSILPPATQPNPPENHQAAMNLENPSHVSPIITNASLSESDSAAVDFTHNPVSTVQISALSPSLSSKPPPSLDSTTHFASVQQCNQSLKRRQLSSPFGYRKKCKPQIQMVSLDCAQLIKDLQRYTLHPVADF